MTHEGQSMASEGNGIWLPLVEYSIKSGVSLSTIRRKIKTNSIPYRLEKGKYLILFSGIVPTYAPELRPEFRTDSYKPVQPAERQSPPAYTPPPVMPSLFQKSGVDPAQLPLIERAVKMVSDAYESTLREKDERIRLLETRQNEFEERVAELQLLVKVLEEKYAIEY